MNENHRPVSLQKLGVTSQPSLYQGKSDIQEASPDRIYMTMVSLPACSHFLVFEDFRS